MKAAKNVQLEQSTRDKLATLSLSDHSQACGELWAWAYYPDHDDTSVTPPPVELVTLARCVRVLLDECNRLSEGNARALAGEVEIRRLRSDNEHMQRELTRLLEMVSAERVAPWDQSE